MQTNNSFDKDNLKVLLLEGVHPIAETIFQKDGYRNVTYHKTALSQDELISTIGDYHFIGIRSRSQLNANVLEHAKKLVAIGCFCIGTNQVDLEAAQNKGIPVFNAPYSNTRSVAELVLGEMIMLLRGIPAKNAAAHRGEWLKTATQSNEARGKTLGIIGYGHIGTQLSVLAEGIGMKVRFFDIENKLVLGNAEPVAELNELLSTSDVISLHVPETPETKGMIGAEQIAQMKQDSILINASRGTVVDIDALAKALEDKHLAGAAIDVFPTEPKSNTEEFVSPLRQFDNVILTPHIGGSTQEAQENIAIEVADKLVKYSNNGSTMSAVNFPQVSLPEHDNRHRILHIHQNRPGVLTQINQILSENNVNISGQYLQTQGELGYVVTDIEEGSSQTALDKMRQIEGTIRARILY
ncbi:phosphoglycerate dehydrogenase [Kangiella sediminilitoris]|uniref:D-3-phosphoglycerate dehydrogenase n=1 Tax=Kangiella sediminilitoris TaxID=1144748 RepID=A0A1B3B7V0_9GAMM|nr:phosphoglycerate dehydrogenase [Kangiella sediminilitoris]AOE48872.1 D-isomer specific 2-hydroxyacid dehydrogenase NAD-binding [Kangiella sediminilitoris]